MPPFLSETALPYSIAILSIDMPYRKYESYTDHDWKLLANIARQQSVLSGFYNKNYRFVHDGTAFLFRFPKTDALQMDPKPIYEGDVYKALQDNHMFIPKFIYKAPDRSFQVQEFIEGTLIDEVYPPGQKIPEAHIERISEFYGSLARLDMDISDVIAADWPRKGPMLTFFEKLLEKAWIIYRDHQDTHERIYDFLKIPEDPFSPFLKKAANLTKRPWRLIHADLHRGNLIEREDGSIVVIDWELALYGDLVFCIAAHLHRSRYYPEEKQRIASEIYKRLPPEFQTNFMIDLEFYLEYEALKSVLTDTVRFPSLFKQEKILSTTVKELSTYYADNLNRVAPIIGCRTSTAEEVMQWLQDWSK